MVRTRLALSPGTFRQHSPNPLTAAAPRGHQPRPLPLPLSHGSRDLDIYTNTPCVLLPWPLESLAAHVCFHVCLSP